MTLIVEAFFLSYLVMVCVLIAGWKKAQRVLPLQHGRPRPDARATTLVSVIIAARNEAENLPLLIRDLQAQRNARFEVIIVDDHSQDNTVAAARDTIDIDRRFHLVPATGVGKKAALSQAVRLSAGAVIMATDADCRAGVDWINAMTRSFDDPSVMMTCGPVAMEGTSLFDRMQGLEFATLIGSGAATSAFGSPTMCNGANLAYRKSGFVAVGGYTGNLSIPSGDDEFLMQKIHQTFPGSVRFCALRQALISTAAAGTLHAFVTQRIRWAGKWRANRNAASKLLAVLVFLFHLGVITLPFLALIGMVNPLIALSCVLAKAAVEYIFLQTLRPVQRVTWSWTAFLLLQLLYSYYVAGIAILSQFKAVEWKGRRVNALMVSGN